LPAVKVAEVTDTTAFCTMLTVARVISPPPPVAVTVPWTCAVPPLVANRKKDAVPVASAAVSFDIELRVRTPAEAAAAKVALQVSSARRVFPERAVPTVAGGVPL
jgi:hypothetical protein